MKKSEIELKFENDIFREALNHLGCVITEHTETFDTTIDFPDGQRLKRRLPNGGLPWKKAER